MHVFAKFPFPDTLQCMGELHESIQFVEFLKVQFAAVSVRLSVKCVI